MIFGGPAGLAGYEYTWLDRCDGNGRGGSAGFYADLLGWEIAVDESLDYGLVAGPGGAPVGGIGQVGAGRHPAGIVVYFPIDDVEQTIAAAQRLGASVAVPPWEIPALGRMAVILDPEGNRLGLMST